MELNTIIAQKDAIITEVTAQNAKLIAQREEEQEVFKNKIRELSEKHLILQDQVAKLQRMIFGRKSERFVPTPENHPNLFSSLEQNTAPIGAPEEVKKKIIPSHERKVSKHRGRQLLKNCKDLEKQIIEIETPHSENSIHIGDLITERLAYKTGKFYIKKYITPKYKEKETGEIVVGKQPSEPIPGSEVDVTFLVYLVVSKFVDHLPEYRQIQIFKRMGVKIATSTMNGWTHKVADLLKPMNNHIQQKILSSGYVLMDESTIRVLMGKKNKSHLGYMWVIYSPRYRCVSFIYHKGRSKQAPISILKNYHGNLQSDGYSVYESIGKSRMNIELSCCNAHARRKFEEALSNDKSRASYAMAMYQQLYKIESDLRDHKEKHAELLDLDTYYTYRKKARSPAITLGSEFKKWMEDQSLHVLPQSPIGKAIAYTITRWEKLTRYIHNGELEIDNNLVENCIRTLALGRKNYLFAGSGEAASNIGIFYSIFGTCKHLDINVSNYLTWYLENVNDVKINNIAELDPWAYKIYLERAEKSEM